VSNLHSPQTSARQNPDGSPGLTKMLFFASLLVAGLGLISVQAKAVQGAGQPAKGQPAKAATPLSQLVKEAEQNNPQILAAMRGWQAATQVPSQVSTLPDPEVMVQQMSAGTPLPFDGFNSVEMTYLGFGVSQSIPYPGKLRLRGEIAHRKADTLRQEADAVRRHVVQQLKTSYFRLGYVQQNAFHPAQRRTIAGPDRKDRSGAIPRGPGQPAGRAEGATGADQAPAG